jgi:hypothetical protein
MSYLRALQKPYLNLRAFGPKIPQIRRPLKEGMLMLKRRPSFEANQKRKAAFSKHGLFALVDVPISK